MEINNPKLSCLKEIVSKLPLNPGIYMMKDENNNIIYVGKAKSLKKRVSQYFNSTKKSVRIQKMVEKIRNIEYIVVSSELEALALECNYIKEYTPKYNVMLKDDKTYPYIKITVNEEYPSIYVTRRKQEDTARYFGPYTDVAGMKGILSSIKEIFPVKRCKYNLNSKSSKNVGPCLYYHIGRCIGPCINDSLKAEYSSMIEQVIMFLDGKENSVANILEKQIEECIQKLEFEKAAILKERMDKICSVFSKQNVSNLEDSSADIWGYAVFGNMAHIQIFMLRQGKISSHTSLVLENVSYEDVEQNLPGIITRYYLEKDTNCYPTKIYARIENEEELNTLSLFLSNKKGKKVQVISPKKGEKLKLIQMVENNINVNFEKNSENKNEVILNSLKELLGINMNKAISNIEVYDISNLKNEYIVGANISWKNGKLCKDNYRKYKIRSTETQNDIACMKEVISRRLNHISNWGKPDLICIDGGKGQVNAVKDMLFSEGILVIGLIKDAKHKTRGIIDLDGVEKDLSSSKKYREVFCFLTMLQDEVHRFVISYHRSLRDKIIQNKTKKQ